MNNSDKLYEAISAIPSFVHITMKWDWVAGIWIVTLDGRGAGREKNIVSISNMDRPDDALHELAAFAAEKYEREFGR